MINFSERNIRVDELDKLVEVFVSCFEEDHFYIDLFGKDADIASRIREDFTQILSYMLDIEAAKGIFEMDNLIAFRLAFDYNKLREEDSEMFCSIFCGEDGLLLDKELFHDKISIYKGKVIYLMSIAVLEEYRRMGIARDLITGLVNNQDGCMLCSDVSSPESLPMYTALGFDISEIAEGYNLVRLYK